MGEDSSWTELFPEGFRITAAIQVFCSGRPKIVCITTCTPHPFVSYIIERTRISYYSSIQNSIKCHHIEFVWGKSILSLRSEMKWISMLRWTENRCQEKWRWCCPIYFSFTNEHNRKPEAGIEKATVDPLFPCFTVMRFFTQNKWSRLARSILLPIYSHRSGFFASYYLCWHPWRQFSSPSSIIYYYCQYFLFGSCLLGTWRVIVCFAECVTRWL